VSKQKAIDPAFQEIADKIFAELPEELAAASHFFMDDKGTCLILDFAVTLGKSDYPLLIEIIKKYNVEFANKKVEGKDSPYFLISKPVTANNTASTPENAAAQHSPNSSSDKIKQHSPLTQFNQNNCEVCEDYGDGCNSTTESGRSHQALCHEALMLQSWQEIAVELQGLRKELNKLNVPERSLRGPSNGASAVSQQSSTEKVQRSTRPTEGHREGDVVWVNDVNQKGEPIEKAFEKDNKRSDGYADLFAKIQRAEQAGKKGFAEAGKWYWLSQHGDYIGRKKAKEWPKK